MNTTSDNQTTTRYLPQRAYNYPYVAFEDGVIYGRYRPIEENETCEPCQKDTFDAKLIAVRAWYETLDLDCSRGFLNYLLFDSSQFLVGVGTLPWLESPERVALLLTKVREFGTSMCIMHPELEEADFGGPTEYQTLRPCSRCLWPGANSLRPEALTFC